MFDRELTLYAHTLAYAKHLLADVADEQMNEQPVTKLNPPVWIIGHLAITTDLGLELLGLPRAAPKEWHDLFDTGTVPSPEPGLYPPKAEMLAGYEAAHRRLDDAVRKHARPESLDRANPFDTLRPTMPTLADLMAHLLTTHEATHLGQLSAWRRAMGLAEVG